MLRYKSASISCVALILIVSVPLLATENANIMPMLKPVQQQNQYEQRFLKFGYAGTEFMSHQNKSRTERLARVKELLQISPETGNPAESQIIQMNESLNRLNKASGNGYVLTEEISEFWNSEIPDQTKREFAYDTFGNNTEMTKTNWAAPRWLNSWKETMSYNAVNNVIELIGQIWRNNQWEDIQKVQYSYNTANNILEENAFSMDNGQWSLLTRNMFTYDGNDRLTGQLYQWWDGTLWDDNWQITFTYDSLASPRTEIWQINWGSGLENDSKTTFSYDANDRETEALLQNWNGSAWENAELSTISYDANGNQSAFLVTQWDGAQWMNSYKADLTYDTNNNQTGTLGYNWAGGSWTNTTRISFTYDANQNNTLYLFEQNPDGAGFSIFIRHTRTFSLLTGIGDDEHSVPDDFELQQNYPNPFNPSTTISFSLTNSAEVTLQIFDLNGRNVATLVSGKKHAGTHRVMFNAHSLASGTYLFRLSTQHASQTKKFLLIK